MTNNDNPGGEISRYPHKEVRHQIEYLNEIEFNLVMLRQELPEDGHMVIMQDVIKSISNALGKISETRNELLEAYRHLYSIRK